MEVAIENIVSYLFAFLLISGILFWYFRKNARKSAITFEKIEKAKTFGLHEPFSLHPVVNQAICIGSGGCIQACPEKDILGIANGKAVPINTSRCVGHGACLQACPVKAISLHIGTEKRGVDLPDLSEEFETSVPMMFIAGELGGMGLIKNAVEQGKQAVEFATKKLNKAVAADYDVAIIGSGPAGISATLTAVKNGLTYVTIDQDTLGGTVYTFPRQKIVMTYPMDLPLYGKIKLRETNKDALIAIWKEVISKYNIKINELEKVHRIEKKDDAFEIESTAARYSARAVILAIGRRGTPRKLDVKGEQLPKVFYRLIEPELITGQDVLVVGGGDSAVESALLLSHENNRVTISYRADSFSRIKPQNQELISTAIASGAVRVMFNTTVEEIRMQEAVIKDKNGKLTEIKNDLVYVQIGGEMPNDFLANCGISVTTKFGEAILKRK